MFYSRRAISTAFAVVVVVILVVAAGGAYVFLSSNVGSGSSISRSTISSSTGTASSTQTSSSTSSSSSTSTHTTTSTSSSTSTQSTTSCASTSTTTTGTSTGSSQALYNFTTLFLNYHAMSTHFNGTFNGQTSDISSDYRVVYVSATTIKVVANLTTGGTTIVYTIHAWKNGTAQSVAFSTGGYGQNYTGAQASSQFFAAMAPYFVLQLFSSPQFLSQFTNSLFVHATSHGTVMIGPATVSVTTYAANNLPLTIPSCNGSTTLSTFIFETGIVSGKSQTLVTNMTINGSIASSSGSASYDVTFKITSITPS